MFLLVLDSKALIKSPLIHSVRRKRKPATAGCKTRPRGRLICQIAHLWYAFRMAQGDMPPGMQHSQTADAFDTPKAQITRDRCSCCLLEPRSSSGSARRYLSGDLASRLRGRYRDSVLVEGWIEKNIEKAGEETSDGLELKPTFRFRPGIGSSSRKSRRGRRRSK